MFKLLQVHPMAYEIASTTMGKPPLLWETTNPVATNQSQSHLKFHSATAQTFVVQLQILTGFLQFCATPTTFE